MNQLAFQDNPALGQLFVSGVGARMSTCPTVRQLVSENPRRARVFERFSIPYCCCGGNKSLSTACVERGLAMNLVTEALQVCDSEEPVEAVCRTTDWLEVPLVEMARHIREVHHSYLHSELPRLLWLGNKVAARHGDLYPELWELQALLDEFQQEMQTHLANEEKVFSPLCEALETQDAPTGGDSLANPVCVLGMEHAFLSEALTRIVDCVRSIVPPEEACNTYRVLVEGIHAYEANFRQCLHEEDHVLFPRAILLTHGILTDN
jgi:regulator of cell morphogenesis and NO signaling